ncbi:MAG: SusC/RagA family TonB-linked outer membrane protein [Candidatus Cyclobacteriaceae bacterium M3_2C_046]
MRRVLLFLLLMGVTTLFNYAKAQSSTVTGTVRTMSGNEEIPGVNVVVKGTSVGTVTDVNGEYNINVPEGSNILVFSFIGLQTKEVQVNNRSVVDVGMDADVKQLSEVVVVAYGEQTRQSITGAVTEIDEEKLGKVQAGNVIQGLVGKVPGVQIINQNGQPGEAPAVRFRGIGSINAANDPLYVVDGIPFNGNINSINPQDIQSMTFLKDASANALYGSRGANGVIIITTKKGKRGGLQVSFDARAGVNTRGVPEYNIIESPAEYYEAYYDRVRLDLIQAQGLNPEDAATQAAQSIIGGDFDLGYNAYDVPGDQLINTSTGEVNSNANLLYQDNWEDALFEPGIRQEYYLNVSSGSDNLSSFFSLGYLNDEGYVVNSGFERFSARLSLDYNVNDFLKIGGNFNYGRTDQDAPLQGVGSSTYSNLFSWVRNIAPIYPVFARDQQGDFILDSSGERIYDFGEANDDIPGVRPYGAFNNPAATTRFDVDNNVYDNFSGRFFASIDFLQDFNFRYNISADIYNGNFTELATPVGGDAKNVGGRLYVSSNAGITLAQQQLLTWNKDIENHKINILLGHESNDFTHEFLEAHRTNMLIGDLPVLNNTSNFQDLTNYERTYNVEGFFGRVMYNFAEKYFINANYRRDGSSVFAPENRWGNFYGVGAAWLMTNEPFMETVGFLDYLKLKASFGQQGNDHFYYDTDVVGGVLRRNYYAYMDQYEVVNSGGGQAGLQLISIGNPNLVWETSTNFNAGFEMMTLNNRLTLNAEYFQRKVEDMIFNNPLPLSSGAESIAENVGDMVNNGIEVELGANIIQTNDIGWNLSLNGTHFTNEVTALPDEFIDDGRFRLEEGRSRYEFFMREFAGVDPENGEALWYVDETDDDGNPTGTRTTTDDYNASDEYFVGKTAIPDIYGGFATDFRFKGITLNVNFAYQIGGYGYDLVYNNSMSSGADRGQNYHRDVFDSWTPENTDASFPRIDFSDDAQTRQSDLFLVDASFLSLQDVTLSYQLPQSLVDAINFSSLNIYATANNVYLWSARQGYDPRLSTVGTASNEYSVMRTISLGVNAKF